MNDLPTEMLISKGKQYIAFLKFENKHALEGMEEANRETWRLKKWLFRSVLLNIALAVFGLIAWLL